MTNNIREAYSLKQGEMGKVLPLVVGREYVIKIPRNGDYHVGPGFMCSSAEFPTVPNQAELELFNSSVLVCAAINGYSNGIEYYSFDVKNSKLKTGFIITNEEIKLSNIEIFEEEEITFEQLANRIGIDDLDSPEIYDIEDEGYEILSFDHGCNEEVWKTLKSFVVKQNAEKHYKAGTLCGTEKHRIWVDGEYVELKNYVDATLIEKPMQVVDCEVKDTHNYIAEGYVNHNTTTPGGMAIPYASSVRLRISGGKHIENKGDTIGINVKVKTIKNKVQKPFREVNFSIYFGIGIIEHEEVFDLLRQYCANSKEGVAVDKEKVIVSGTSAWKSFIVTDADTGEVKIEEKFYKTDFGKKILYKEEYSKYIDALMDAALIMDTNSKEHYTFTGINSDSYEETNNRGDDE